MTDFEHPTQGLVAQEVVKDAIDAAVEVQDQHKPEDKGKAPAAAVPEAEEQGGGCEEQQEAAGEDRCENPSSPSKSTTASEEDDSLCAICLHTPALEDIAIVKGCDHTYCVKCILAWASHKEESAWCPQCKKPFSRLITYRSLDGSLNDYPQEESVVLLKRACWFEEHLRALEKGKSPLSHPAAHHASHEDWLEEQLYAQFYDEYDEDQEVEDYYFSAAAGRARVTIGNRRWGDGGYVSSGRRAARPVLNRTPSGKSTASSHGSGATAGGHKASPSPHGNGGHMHHAASHKQLSRSPGNGGGSSSGSASPAAAAAAAGAMASGGKGGKGGGQGRRARRNARRAAYDYDDDF